MNKLNKMIPYIGHQLEVSCSGVWITPRNGKAFFLPATLISELVHEILVLNAQPKGDDHVK